MSKKKQLTKAERMENVRNAMKEVSQALASIPDDLEGDIREHRHGGPAITAIFNYLAPGAKEFFPVKRPDRKEFKTDKEFEDAAKGYFELLKLIRTLGAFWFYNGIHYDEHYDEFIKLLDEAKKAE